jgi:hypothetical protein
MSVVQNNVYKYNNSTGSSVVSISPPPGSIMAYMGTTDPDGWIICDGTQRTNGSDGKYNNLINMTIGTGTVNTANYTPPDYKGAYLRGIGTSSLSASYVGPTTVGTSQSPIVQNHTHDVTWTNQGTVAGAGVAYMTINYGGNNLTGGVNGGTTNTETRVFNYGVNWIMKL